MAATHTPGMFRRKSDSDPDPVRDPEPSLAQLDEVVAWRTMGLIDLGFSLEQVARLVNRPDVVHEAERLLVHGAPHSFVTEELS